MPVRHDKRLNMDLYDYPTRITNTWIQDQQFQVLKNGSPVDLTNFSIEQHVKDKHSGASLRIIKVGSGITITDAVNGLYKIDAFQLTIKGGEYIHETKMLNALSRPYRYVRGDYPIEDSIA